MSNFVTPFAFLIRLWSKSNRRAFFRSVGLLLLATFLSGCGNTQPETNKEIDLTEARITRWTALEGSETLVLRKLGESWNARLLGDLERFGCYYDRGSVRPSSEWNAIWSKMVDEGLLTIPDKRYRAAGITDGNGYKVEVLYQGKYHRYSFANPNFADAEARKILNIGNMISQEFDTPVFAADYDRGQIGGYFLTQCGR